LKYSTDYAANMQMSVTSFPASDVTCCEE